MDKAGEGHLISEHLFHDAARGADLLYQTQLPMKGQPGVRAYGLTAYQFLPLAVVPLLPLVSVSGLTPRVFSLPPSGSLAVPLSFTWRASQGARLSR